MDLMHVKLRDLSDALYVSPTTVSKWRTGARFLPPESAHMAAMVDYFVALSRDPRHGEAMRSMLATQHPEMPLHTREGLSGALQAFLSENMLPVSAADPAPTDDESLYRTEFSVYGGVAGRLQALEAFLYERRGHAGHMLAICCTLFDTESMLAALRAGARLQMLLDPTLLPAIAGSFAPLVAQASVSIRLMPEAETQRAFRLLSIAREDRLLMGSEAYGEPCYTALYTDECTVRQHRMAHKALFDRAFPLFQFYGPGALRAGALESLLECGLKERMDLYMPSLPHLTMSKDLLMEVLTMNGVAGSVWTRIFSCYTLFCAKRIRIYTPSRQIRGDTLPELYSQVGEQVALNTVQQRRHLLDTSALLRADAVEVRPCPHVPLRSDEPCVFCLRNGFVALMDPAQAGAAISTDARVIDAFMQRFDALESSLTQELKDGGHVASLLERLALEE